MLVEGVVRELVVHVQTYQEAYDNAYSKPETVKGSVERATLKGSIGNDEIILQHGLKDEKICRWCLSCVVFQQARSVQQVGVHSYKRIFFLFDSSVMVRHGTSHHAIQHFYRNGS